MTRRPTTALRPALVVLLGIAATACAAVSPKSERAPQSRASGAGESATSDSANQARPQTTPAAPGHAPSEAPHDERAASAGAPPATPQLQASREIEAAQRELDVAAGDCRNACRALGSMDRATGRLCNLAQSTDDRHRCDDAKTRVQSARVRVKSTCGTCPDVSVDKNDPIPSR